MINIELGEYYGCENEKEMMEAINTCRELGMSDAEINEVLKRSKHDGEKESDRMENIKASDIQPDDEWMQENDEMRKKIKFYKSLLIEIIETLCTICLYLLMNALCYLVAMKLKP